MANNDRKKLKEEKVDTKMLVDSEKTLEILAGVTMKAQKEIKRRLSKENTTPFVPLSLLILIYIPRPVLFFVLFCFFVLFFCVDKSGASFPRQS